MSKRKKLGQHFLRDRGVALSIAELTLHEMIEKSCTALLEIGPGKGALTLPLLDQIQLKKNPLEKMLLVEKDPQLVSHWQAYLIQHQQKYPFLQLQEADFLDLSESTWRTHTPLAVVSNLPYSAGTAMVIRLAQHYRAIPVMILMFQAEVAQRLRAEPDTHAWGSLSVWIQNRWNVKKFLSVPAEAFSPPPQVSSEVIVMTPRTEPRVPVAETKEAEKQWQTLLRLGFSQRRKMLRSLFPKSGPWRIVLEQSGIDDTKRPGALSWEEWGRLYLAFWLMSKP